MSNFKTNQKISIQTNGSDFESMKELLVAVTDAKELCEDCGMQAFKMRDGSLLELYTEYGMFPPYLFKQNKVVVSFKVNDINHTMRLLKKLEIKILTSIVKVSPTLRYCHIELKNNTVIGFYQEGTY